MKLTQLKRVEGTDNITNRITPIPERGFFLRCIIFLKEAIRGKTFCLANSTNRNSCQARSATPDEVAEGATSIATLAMSSI
jgi:hypothetical protein